MMLSAVVLAVFAPAIAAVITEISPDELEMQMMSGFLQVLVDVRTQSEFDAGHIENATLVDSLALAGTTSEITNWETLNGCQDCNIAVYCRSGARADTALRHLDENGFVNLYDAAGINQWTASGRQLVTGLAITARCTLQPELRACEVGNTTGCPGEATGSCADFEKQAMDEDSAMPTNGASTSKGQSRANVGCFFWVAGLFVARNFF